MEKLRTMSHRLPIATLAVVTLMAVAFAQKTPTPKQQSSGANAAASGTALVDLNAASEKDLDALPGIGPASAKKIIDHRPYVTVDDLSKAGLTAKQIDRI